MKPHFARKSRLTFAELFLHSMDHERNIRFHFIPDTISPSDSYNCFHTKQSLVNVCKASDRLCWPAPRQFSIFNFSAKSTLGQCVLMISAIIAAGLEFTGPVIIAPRLCSLSWCWESHNGVDNSLALFTFIEGPALLIRLADLIRCFSEQKLFCCSLSSTLASRTFCRLFTMWQQFQAMLHGTALFKLRFSLHILTLLFKVTYLLDECFLFCSRNLFNAITIVYRYAMHIMNLRRKVLVETSLKPEACDNYYWQHHKADKLNYEYNSFLE